MQVSLAQDSEYSLCTWRFVVPQGSNKTSTCLVFFQFLFEYFLSLFSSWISGFRCWILRVCWHVFLRRFSCLSSNCLTLVPPWLAYECSAVTALDFDSSSVASLMHLVTQFTGSTIFVKQNEYVPRLCDGSKNIGWKFMKTDYGRLGKMVPTASVVNAHVCLQELWLASHQQWFHHDS